MGSPPQRMDNSPACLESRYPSTEWGQLHIVHEMCHLLDRSHDASFWRLLSRVMPDYADRKQWLEHNELSCRWG
jgi:hypothetical protein